MPHVNTGIFRDTMIFLDEQLKEGKLDAAVRLELPARGFEEKLRNSMSDSSGASVALAT
jgi:predicted methyltransferase MtxX (methanogen marker protein 4)